MLVNGNNFIVRNSVITYSRIHFDLSNLMHNGNLRYATLCPQIRVGWNGGQYEFGEMLVGSRVWHTLVVSVSRRELLVKVDCSLARRYFRAVDPDLNLVRTKPLGSILYIGGTGTPSRGAKVIIPVDHLVLYTELY